MTREVWQHPAWGLLHDPELDELMRTGPIPVVTSGPRHARVGTGGPNVNDKTKRTVRTVLQVILGLAVSLPLLLDATGLQVGDWPYLAGFVAVCGVVARLMQSDVFERLAEDWLGGRLTVGGAGSAPVLPPVVVPVEDEHDGVEPV